MCSISTTPPERHRTRTRREQASKRHMDGLTDLLTLASQATLPVHLVLSMASKCDHCRFAKPHSVQKTQMRINHLMMIPFIYQI